MDVLLTEMPVASPAGSVECCIDLGKGKPDPRECGAKLVLDQRMQVGNTADDGDRQRTGAANKRVGHACQFRGCLPQNILGDMVPGISGRCHCLGQTPNPATITAVDEAA